MFIWRISRRRPRESLYATFNMKLELGLKLRAGEKRNKKQARRKREERKKKRKQEKFGSRLTGTSVRGVSTRK